MDARPLIDEASAALQAQDYETAARVAQSIIDVGHSSGYELLAHAEKGRGNLERAIEVLEEGVQAAPSVWLLWHLLANGCSDAGNYPRAFECYRAALECPQVDESYVYYNYALAVAKGGKPALGLELLEKVKSEELQFAARSLRVRVLNELEQYAEAVDEGERAAKVIPSSPAAADLALLSVHLAVAHRHLGDRRTARQWCEVALEAVPSHEDAQLLFAELGGPRKWWQVWR